MKRRTLLIGVAGLAGCQGAAIQPQPSQRVDDTPLRRIAFGSCNDQNKPQHMWTAVLDSPGMEPGATGQFHIKELLGNRLVIEKR